MAELTTASRPRSRQEGPEFRSEARLRRRLRFKRQGRRAYIRSVYFLPSMATLCNAICGFISIYIAALGNNDVGNDPWAQSFSAHPFTAAAYFIFAAMIFDVLDGRLARFTRHTTDFGGQLDSLADMISFGAAPAFLALQVFKHDGPDTWIIISRLVWAIGALYVACAAIRLARFNVSNEHGEQHHFSFLGLPSPGAAATVAGLILMHQQLMSDTARWPAVMATLTAIAVWLLPMVMFSTAILMISTIRFPHLVNQNLRGQKSIARMVVALGVLLLLIVAHEYTIGLAALAYVIIAMSQYALALSRRSRPAA